MKLAFWGGMIALVAGVVAAFVYSGIARGYDLEKVGQMPERSQVFDRNGITLGRLHGENRSVVPLGAVSPHFVAAVLAREDNRFHEHGGIDFLGVLRAAVRNVRERRVVQGASTITMQLARNSFGIFDKSIHRKLVEMALARRIERRFSKEEILEAYVNRIYYGTGLYGVERASQAYFGKPAGQLTLGEAAMLAGIIRGPNRFSPFRNPEGAHRERDAVLARMVAVGRIPEGMADEARQGAERILEPRAESLEQSYALDAVRRDLDLVLDEQDVEDGGLRIFTTIEARLQSVAEAALDRRLAEVEKQPGYRHQTRAAFRAARDRGAAADPAYLQGAVMVVDNLTGGILAIVGGRDFEESQFNRAILSKRQVGSTFKPFVYAAGFEHGLFPGTLVSDNPIRPGELRTVPGDWSPQNSDGRFLGAQPAAVGLVRSRNTMTVRVGDRAGFDAVADLARRAGFPEIVERSPQVFIGNLGATLRSVTSAMSVFPNNGMRRRPFVIDRIEDRNGDLIFQSGVIEYPVVSPGLGAMVASLLGQVLEPGGTGARARELGFTDAGGGKTGTTDDYQDAWFVGFNDRITCGVWVGLDRPARIIDRGYGSVLALPIWTDVMKHAGRIGLRLDAPRARPLPARVELCRVTAELAAPGCRQAGTAYTEAVPYELVPRDFCHLHGTTGPGGPPRPGSPAAAAAPAGRRLFDRIRDWFR